MERAGAPAASAAARQKASARVSKAAGSVLTGAGLEDGELAARYKAQTEFPVCGHPGATCPPRLLAGRSQFGRMAAGRVAQTRSRAHQILAVYHASQNEAEGTGANCQTALAD